MEPEGREQMLRGQRLYTAPAAKEHGDPHFQLDAVLGTHLAHGYTGSTDLLTRVSATGEIASDTCVRRAGIDPQTGERYLEELAFEVVNAQSVQQVSEKAQDFVLRGVRRVFALFVKRGELCEWRRGQWVALAANGAIEDPCLAAPLPVAALLQAGAIGAAAVQGLLARGEPTLLRLLNDAGRDGERVGKTEGLRPLQHLFERRLGRALSAEEASVLLARLDTLGPARLGDVVLDLPPDALAAWLGDPDAA